MAIYRLRLKGRLDPRRSAWFEGLAVTASAGGETVLTGELSDQAALHGVLAKVRDLGLELITVTRLGPGREGHSGVDEAADY